MTLTEAIETAHARRQGERSTRAKRDRAELEELVVELQARVAAQIGDHATESRLINDYAADEIVSDRTFSRAARNVAWQIGHGDADAQRQALSRLLIIHARDEAAEDALVAALVSLLGVHNADAHAIGRLVRANTRAIVHGEPVTLEIQLPRHLIEAQRNGKGVGA